MQYVVVNVVIILKLFVRLLSRMLMLSMLSMLYML